MTDIQKINAPSIVTGSAPGGTDWFGPSQPVRPIAQEVAGRTWDYPTGFNLAIQPRAYEQVPFPALRALADSYDPVRLVIERRKDQMCRLKWSLRYRHDAKSKNLTAQQRSTLREFENFFRQPAAEYSWRSWLRGLIEDLLVLDAPAIHCVRNSYGDLAELVPIDGAMVGRIIGDDGRPPKPFQWDGRPFEWLGRTITGADLDAIGARIVDGLVYMPAYRVTMKGLPAWYATTWDMVYAPSNVRPGRPFGFSPVEQIINTVSTAMRRQASQAEWFREGNVPEGVMGLPENWTVDQVKQFQDHWDSMLAGNQGRRRQMRFMAGDGKWQAFKEPPLKNDFDVWLCRIVALAFSYPPTAFADLSNRSVSESHERQAEEEGLDPLKQWVKEVVDGVLFREFPGEDVEFVFAESEEVDPLKESTVIQRLVDSAVMTRNEARERVGLPPDPSPNASKLAIKTASGFVPIDTDQYDVATDDSDVAKRAKRGGIVTVVAPADWIPGTRGFPTRLTVTEKEAASLEREGWTRA